jgi:SAM-dependent methyltransferase
MRGASQLDLREGGSAPTAEQVRAMTYNELIGLVRETNRPPGGFATLATISRAAGLRPGRCVLEIGCATGYAGLELAAFSGSDVVGIDINGESIAEAQRRAKAQGLTNARFQVADAGSLPFADDQFDLVMCGNVTSLLSDRANAVAEYIRVLKPRGLLACTPMYYIQAPALTLVVEVRKAIGVNIPIHFREDALALYRSLPLQPVVMLDYRFDDVATEAVDAYCQAILARPHLHRLGAAAMETLAEVYRTYMQLFGTNLASMGFTILLLRKAPEGEDPELFSAQPVTSS